MTEYNVRTQSLACLSPRTSRAPVDAGHEKARSVIHYRSFRNPDPPVVADLWNACLAGPRTVLIQPRATGILEYFTLGKPYFDPAGLILAFEEDRPVGLVHAGFGPSADGQSLDRSKGIICTLGVIPSHRGQGIGRELLRRAEDYLRQHGAREILAGPASPLNPFTFGLYGSSDSVGFLSGEESARPFFEHLGYQMDRMIGVFQRSLKRQQLPTDPRFLTIHAHYDIVGTPYTKAGWWRECVLGPIEAVEYRLQEKNHGQVVARIVLWDMATFGYNWGESSVGLLELHVREDLRRQGLAKYLFSQVLLHLHHQSFERFEACAELSNTAALQMFRTLGLQQVETGYTYRRS